MPLSVASPTTMPEVVSDEVMFQRLRLVTPRQGMSWCGDIISRCCGTYSD